MEEIIQYLPDSFRPFVLLFLIAVSFFFGLRLRLLEVKSASNKADQLKMENFKRGFEINSELIEAIKEDFNDRITSLKDHISQLEEMNTKLHNLLIKERETLDKYVQKYGNL
ncbi:hypothetical protein ACQY1Q_06080 [Tenacibaculum sp. TC6]|uniref:hypothetical protein n=1 Tax=Tenacibaculum sp. TC6 TaxID=3423223 RepID=UPI003D365ADE